MKKSAIGLAGLVLLTALASMSAWAADVKISNAPENDLSLTQNAIASAQSTLLINIYELTSAQIVDVILNRIQAGVHVEIIEEGQPVGGLSSAAKGVQSQLVAAMNAAGNGDQFFNMTSKAERNNKRRYRFDHAKYIVIDDAELLIGSENYSPTGNPNPGSVGNRGWEVLVRDADLAQQYKATFTQDSDTSAGDIQVLTSGTGAPRHLLAQSAGNVGLTPTYEASAVMKITSPDSSLAGLTGMLERAQTSIDPEQMTFDSAWKGADQSPLLDAVLAAARRHVKIRILLNDESVFDHPSHPAKPTNTTTADLLNQTAQSEGLDLEARIANLRGMGVDYIHNKGALIDGNMTLISSINWDENSVMHNRESAVLLASPQIAAYYGALFTNDWNVSATSGGRPNPVPGNEFTSKILMAPASVGQLATLPARECPTKLHVAVKVGELLLTGADDGDFSFLSSANLDEDFVRDTTRGRTACLLVPRITDIPDSLNKHKFIEVRERADGTRVLTLEGYTPHDSKIYSIRALVEPGQPMRGRLDAAVFNGSGPAREQLGNAVMLVTTAMQDTKDDMSEAMLFAPKARPQPQGLPDCLDNDGSVIPAIDPQVVTWEHTTANQFLARAHVQGTITQLYPNHSGHQHFAIQIGPDESNQLEVIYNISFGAIPDPKVGDQVEACGDYITSTAQSGPYPPSPVGAIIHWIHASDSSKHQSGYVSVNGVVYGQGSGDGRP